MRLFYISSGCGFSFSPTLTAEDVSIIRAFRQLEKERAGFTLQTFLLKREPLNQLLPRIRAFRPDVVLVLKGFRFSHTLVQAIRQSGYRIGVWLVDDPYRLQTHQKITAPYHFVLTQEASCVPVYRQSGKVSLHMPLAVDPQKYYAKKTVPKKYTSDICFVGSGFPARIALFDTLAPYLREKKTIIIGQWWERLRAYRALKQCILNRPVPPSEVTNYYNGAKIVLNIHRTANDRGENVRHVPAVTPNHRTFEIAACGAFQLASHRKETFRYFKRGELVTFNDWRDLQQKIDYYLQHSEKRSAVASRGWIRARTDHTYKKRLTNLIEQLNAYVLAATGRGEQ